MTPILNRQMQARERGTGRTSIARILIASIILLSAPLAAVDLYTVEVPMDPSDPGAREAAYAEALELVLVRVTGSDDELQREELADAFPNPGRYVLRFRPAEDNRLQVTFDGVAIERMLRQMRRTVWNSDRPLTLVWLAVDWGNGEREIVGADDALQSAGVTRSIDRNRLLRERVEKTAERRGVPVAFPLLDAEDLEAVSFSDIWGGFDEPLLEASRRYGASSILVGRVRPDSAQSNRWTYYFGDDRRVWNGEPEAITNLLADELAAQFAVAGDAQLESFTLRIDGIDSVVAYGRIEQMLSKIGVIEDFSLRRVSGRQLEYRVRLYGDIDRLNKALELSGVIKPRYVVDAGSMSPVPDPNLLTFEYRP